MIENQKELLARSEECLRIGITETGFPKNAIKIPWRSTSHSLNMLIPQVYISKEDLNDVEIMTELFKHRVVGCYIFSELENYMFLNKLIFLQDLFIKDAQCLHDISFMKNLHDCKMLYLHGACIESLKDIVETKKLLKTRYVNCLCLEHCQIKDFSSVLLYAALAYSEFNVILPKKSEERQKWESISSNSRRLVVY